MYPRIVMIGVTASWGSTFLIIHNEVVHIPPGWLLFYRFLLATLILLPFAVNDKKATPWGLGIWAGVFLFLGYYLQTLGLQFTGPDRSAFITGLNVLFIPLFSTLFLRQPLRPSTVTSGLFIIIGLALFLSPRGGINLGDWLTLGSAMVLAGQVLSTGGLSESASFLRFTAIELGTTTILSLVPAGFESPPQWQLGSVTAILYLGIIATALALIGQTWGQLHVSSYHAGLIFSFEPVFATIFGITIAERPLTTIQVVGGVLMIVTVLHYERALHKGDLKNHDHGNVS